ncbi:TatD family hydrolase [candidate division WWE3 bacterium]|nr:TatD family hydrolase [candidate division WWE3 bacterium]
MLIDSHFHLTSDEYPLKNTVIENAKEVGVTKLITIGTYLKDDAQVIELIEKYPNLYGVVGIYPHEELELQVHEMEKSLKNLLLMSKKIVGIGECGIDVPKSSETPLQIKHETRSLEKQIEIFEMQIKLAIENNLPVVIHNRNGDDVVLSILEKYQKIAEDNNKKLKGVIHCFTSTWEIAQKFIEIGFYISFSGIITYPSGKAIHETVAKIPLDKFIVETDAPWLTPQGFRGKINEPKYVRMTAQKVSEIKGLSEEEICKVTYKNTCDLFGLPA